MDMLALVANAASGIFSFVEAIDTLQAIILILGLVLLVVEVFVPGFGIAGGTGLLLLILGIILTARNAFEAFMMVLVLLVILAIFLTIILRSAKKGVLARRGVLQSAARAEDGYRSTSENVDLVGREGITLTVLRPAGSADFAGEKLDVVAEGTFIQSQTRVKVVRVEGRRIVVRPIQE